MAIVSCEDGDADGDEGFHGGRIPERWRREKGESEGDQRRCMSAAWT